MPARSQTWMRMSTSQIGLHPRADLRTWHGRTATQTQVGGAAIRAGFAGLGDAETVNWKAWTSLDVRGILPSSFSASTAATISCDIDLLTGLEVLRLDIPFFSNSYDASRDNRESVLSQC